MATVTLVGIHALGIEACAALTKELRKRGCEPSAFSDAQELPVGAQGFEHCICVPMPAEGDPKAFDGLGYPQDVENIDGLPLDLITPTHLQKMASAAAERIAAKTKTPVFGRLYTPKAVESACSATDGLVILRLVRAYDPVRCRYVTRFDCLYRLASFS
jgi:hypothetical protein